MPVSRTKQVDAGLRYAVTPQLTFVAGVFEVEKPYFNVNAANVFGPLGAVSHRGIEVSLAGQVLTEGLRIVSGMVLIQPRISGDAVERGIIGRTATGVRPRTVLLSVQYQPKVWRGFGIDGRITHYGPQHAHQDNLFKIQGSSTLDLGARYNFRVSDVPASVRFRAQNITDTYQFMLSPTGNFVVRPGRRFTLTLAADF